MRIGVVSDTHNQLSNTARIVELFNATRVDRVVHTGDITQAKTLRVLSALDAPLVGVYGNNDLERESLERACEEFGMCFVDPPLHFEWEDRHGALVFNPGECAGHMPGRNSVGVLDLTTLHAKILNF